MSPPRNLTNNGERKRREREQTWRERDEGSSDSRKFLINTHQTTYKTKANLSPLGLAMNELRMRKVEMGEEEERGGT